MSGNTKIRGRQIETDDFIKSQRNADWTNDANTASQKAIAAFVSEHFVFLEASGTDEKISVSMHISEIIKHVEQQHYVVLIYKNRLYNLYDFQTTVSGTRFVYFSCLEQKNLNYIKGEQDYINGSWGADTWMFALEELNYTRSYSVPNPALVSSGGTCTWAIGNADFDDKNGTKAICIVKSSRGSQMDFPITYERSTITISISSSADIAAGAYTATIVV